MMYKDFVKTHMSGKKFNSQAEVRAHMSKIAQMWQAEKMKMSKSKKGKGGNQKSLLGDIVGEALNAGSNLARKYL